MQEIKTSEDIRTLCEIIVKAIDQAMPLKPQHQKKYRRKEICENVKFIVEYYLKINFPVY